MKNLTIDEFLSFFFYAIKSARFRVTLITITIVLLLCIIIRSFLKTKVNCWFCNANRMVRYHKRNSWICPKCLQYNGFKSDGDYNKEIKEQYSENAEQNRLKYTINTGASGSVTNILCDKCNYEQELKIEKIKQFEPENNNKESYGKQLKKFKQSLENGHPLCHQCTKNVDNYIRRQNDSLNLLNRNPFQHHHDDNNSLSYNIFTNSSKSGSPLNTIYNTHYDNANLSTSSKLINPRKMSNVPSVSQCIPQCNENIYNQIEMQPKEILTKNNVSNKNMINAHAQKNVPNQNMILKLLKFFMNLTVKILNLSAAITLLMLSLLALLFISWDCNVLSYSILLGKIKKYESLASVMTVLYENNDVVIVLGNVVNSVVEFCKERRSKSDILSSILWVLTMYLLHNSNSIFCATDVRSISKNVALATVLLNSVVSLFKLIDVLKQICRVKEKNTFYGRFGNASPFLQTYPYIKSDATPTALPAELNDNNNMNSFNNSNMNEIFANRPLNNINNYSMYTTNNHPADINNNNNSKINHPKTKISIPNEKLKSLTISNDVSNRKKFDEHDEDKFRFFDQLLDKREFHKNLYSTPSMSNANRPLISPPRFLHETHSKNTNCDFDLSKIKKEPSADETLKYRISRGRYVTQK